MSIPELQLETWSHQGSVNQSSDTYNQVKSILESDSTPYANKNFGVFLQGSYGNDTNIYAESDVDIVIRLDECWQRDISELPVPQQEAYKSAHEKATYTHVEFKRDVLAVLKEEYGSDVKSGSKAIAIAANDGRRKVDVIAAVQYRRYSKFNGISDQSYAEGICFWDSTGESIANYPKQHSTNLTQKHQSTNKYLKPMIRVLKNMRSQLVDNDVIKAGVAPSYYLEGLLYNVPDSKYGDDYQDCFVSAINWIQNEADKQKLLCANEQYYLIRDGAKTCWPVADSEAFLTAAIDLWNNW